MTWHYISAEITPKSAKTSGKSVFSPWSPRHNCPSWAWRSAVFTQAQTAANLSPSGRFRFVDERTAAFGKHSVDVLRPRWAHSGLRQIRPKQSLLQRRL